MRLDRISVALAIALWGCLPEGRPAPTPDASHPGDAADLGPRILSWAIRGVSGRVYEPTRAPRRPVLVVEASAPVFAEPEPALLLDGALDDALTEDLARAPLRSANEARRVPASVTSRGSTIELRPLVPLVPGAVYVLAVPAWAADASGTKLADPFVATLRVADAPEAGAIVTDAWPADGTVGVPAHLPMVALRFDGEVEGLEAIVLHTVDGPPIPSRRQSVLCELVGWHGGRCLLLRPDGPLAEGTTHHVDVTEDVRDVTGASIGPWRASFRTSGGGAVPEPSFVPPACALDEDAVAVGCALADDRSLTLRVGADGPLRLWLVTDSASDHAVAPRGEAVLRLERLAPGAAYDAVLRAVDLAGRERAVSLSFETEADLPVVAITEVRADPLGPEPAQEYVEIANLWGRSVDLAGFALSDRADREGDVVARSIDLPPLGRALLVADAFDPVHPDDEPVPGGVPLVRLGTSLAGGGLTNAGEPLYLRDAEGRRLSAAPPLAPPRAGTCIVRTASDPRRGDAAAFAPDAEGGCTPGRADRLP
jgi:hypothetical protein